MSSFSLFPWLLRAIVFLSAFILFQIELISSQSLLPVFGGSFQVWSTCLVFFNLVLLLGYATVDYLNSKLGHPHYPKIHFVIMLISIFLFSSSIHTPIDLAVSDSFFSILKTLLIKIGLPFYLLSMTLPLVQLWLSRTSIDKSYGLYFYSGLGSVLGLISSPLLFNYFFKISEHWTILKTLYYILVALMLPVALMTKNTHSENSPNSQREKGLGLWIFGSFVTCLLMLAVTNIVSQLIGSIPLVWTIPLIIFLFSFMVIFKPWYSTKFLNTSIFILAACFIVGKLLDNNSTKYISFSFELFGLYGFLFVTCCLINRQLYLIRPMTGTSHFNLFLNIGGLVATLFVSLLLPQIGQILQIQMLEIYISIFFLALFLYLAEYNKLSRASKKRILSIMSVPLSLFVVDLIYKPEQVAFFRSYYNISQIIDRNEHRYLLNGDILHGAQFKDPAKARFPISYYHPKGPFADVMGILPQTQNVAVIGLGVGSMAYYGKAQEKWTFFEIDQVIENVAKNYFTYVSQSKAQIDIKIGDGRILLSQSPEKFDLIILDAFSGDSIPAHLVTKEALEIYFSKLKNSDGAVVIHISNFFINLLSVLKPNADELGLKFACLQRSLEDELGATNSVWCVMTKNENLEKSLLAKGWLDGSQSSVSRSWSDDYISFIQPMYLMLRASKK
ncbi:MAG: fused MFS/spermidine synthase [Bacteriovoracaceae bacterium]|nr:fused MFS/spermidine synthase [Bacteriovoracaceae bacterium]